MDDATLTALADEGWTLADGGLRKEFVHSGFQAAIAWVVRVGFVADRLRHHPDIHVSYKTVTLTLVTHEAGGVTEKDVELARKIDAITW